MTLGDFDASSVIYFKFTTTRPSTGAPYTLAGTPAISVYKDNSTTQSTTGVTLTADFDSVTGLNHVAIDTSADGTFYAAGSFFDVVITTGTVDSVSAVGTVVGRFTLRKTSALKPTTAGRTLNVSTGGEAGLDWANIGSPTTAVNLSGTNIDTDQVVASVSGAVGSVTGSVGGNVVGSVGSVTAAITLPTAPADWITAASLAADAVTEIQSGLATASALSTVAGYLDTEIAAILADTNELQTDWANGGRLDLILDARASQSSVDTIDDFLDTEVAAIKAKTDQLTFTVANQVDSNALTGGGGLDAAGVRAAVGLASANLDTQLSTIDTVVDSILVDTAEIGAAGAGLTALATQSSVNTIDDFLDTEIAAIKAKTDNLPANPADAADISVEVFGFNVDGTKTFKEVMQIMAASVAGKVSGAPGSPVFRNLADDRNVITATVDSSGNRSSITYNPAG
jgi:hypothetical protein